MADPFLAAIGALTLCFLAFVAICSLLAIGIEVAFACARKVEHG